MANDLAKKLLLHKATRAKLVNVPGDYVTRINSELPENVQFVDEPAKSLDFVLLFVQDSGELKGYLPGVLDSLQEDGLFWVAYPKKSSKMKSDLNRDFLVSLLHEVNHEGVSLISIDDTWSAMRVRPRKA